jgi:dolichyl-phosphate beta-glucosyltransferase
MQRPHLTLILPVYNETHRLVPGLTAAIAYLQKQTYPWELIIVDDGSRIPVREFLKGTPVAIARGVAVARGTYIVFSDVDFSVDISILPVVLSALSHSPVVIASRRAPDAVIGTHQPILRETAGRLFTYFSNTLLELHVFDSTCGFKGFERRAAKRLFRDLVIGGWVFDAEVLWRARHWGIEIVQVPVHWSDKKGTHVHIPDVFHAWIDLFKLWVHVSTHP